MVGLDVTNLKASELQQEVLELRRRVKKLTALLRLALALLRSSATWKHGVYSRETRALLAENRRRWRQLLALLD